MRILSTLAIVCLFHIALSAQIVQKEASMSEGLYPSLEFEVKGDKKNAEKAWKDYTKKLGKLERDRRADEYELLGALIATIDASNPVTLVTKFEEFSDITRVNVWVKTDAKFLSEEENAAEIEGAKVFLNDYRLIIEKEYIADQLDTEEKELKKLEKELDKLKSKNEDLHRDIEKAKDEIKKAEREIEQNLKDQDVMKKEIEKQQRQVKSVSEKMNKVGKN